MLVPAIIGILAVTVSLIFFIVKKVKVKKLNQKENELKEAEKKASKKTTGNQPKIQTGGNQPKIQTGGNQPKIQTGGNQPKKTKKTTSDLTTEQQNSLNSRLENIRNLYVKEANRLSTPNEDTKNAMSFLINNSKKLSEINPLDEIIYYKKKSSIDIQDLLNSSPIYNPKKRLREQAFQKGTQSIINIHNPENLKIHDDGLFTRLQNNKNADSSKAKGTILYNKIKEKFQMTGILNQMIPFHIKDNNWKDLTLLLLNKNTKLKNTN
jgi:hypothetical protein